MKDEQKKSPPNFFRNDPLTVESLDSGLRTRLDFDKKRSAIFAKYLTKWFGTMWFLAISTLFMMVWISINLGFVRGLSPFDPHPLDTLIIIIEVFSILLPIIVLINQNRQDRIAEIRQQMEFEINVRTEDEVTKVIHMLCEINDKLGITSKDPELEVMKEKIDIQELKDDVEQVVDEENDK